MNVSSSGTRTGDYGGVARVEGTPFEMFHVISGRNVFRKGASTRRVAGQTDVSRQADRVHARVLLQDPEPSGAENFGQAEWDRAKRILENFSMHTCCFTCLRQMSQRQPRSGVLLAKSQCPLFCSTSRPVCSRQSS